MRTPIGQHLGPRNLRRLVRAAVAVAVLGAVAVTALLLGLFSPARLAPKSERPYLASGRFDFYSGMSKGQVLQQTGLPTAKRGGCWRYDTNRPIQYRTSHGKRNGLLTAVRVCFYAEHVSGVRYQIDGKWSPV
jgi:hypothetical protein